MLMYVFSAGDAAVEPAVINQATELLTQRLPMFVHSGKWRGRALLKFNSVQGDVEVQERAVFAVELMKIISASLTSGL